MTVRIAYFGSSDFSASVLKKLVEEGFEIPLVITQPDKPVGRKGTLTPTPVKTMALGLGLEVDEPPSLKKLEPLYRLRELSLDFGVVVAYGKILPERILQTAKSGFLNGHASHLPVLRGAAPIQRAILEGHANTGMCIMQMSPRLDDGDVLAEEMLPIGADEGFLSLEQRLLASCCRQLPAVLHHYGDYAERKMVQDDSKATYAEKIVLEDGLIQIEEGLQRAYARIRALEAGSGGIFTLEDGRRLAVFAARCEKAEPKEVPGTVLLGKKFLKIAFPEGYLDLLEVQLSGKKRLPVAAFLNGSPLEEKSILQSGR